MSDRPIILTGLVFFLMAATLPVWYNVATHASAEAPVLQMPKTAPRCVAPRDVMRASHAALLASWREDVVRRGARVYVAYDGHKYTKSLTGTCLKCHQDKAGFCDRCHDYAGATMSCGDCHGLTRLK